MKLNLATARKTMTQNQLQPFGVNDSAVLSAFDVTPREDFLPVDKKDLAYVEGDLVYDQKSGHFLLDLAVFARLTQEMAVFPGMKILNLIAGCGYDAAILCELGASVTAVETKKWAEKTELNCRGYAGINVEVSDSVEVLSTPSGIFDVVYMGGMITSLPDNVVLSLKDGGKVYTILYDVQTGRSSAVRGIKTSQGITWHSLFEASALPLEQFFDDSGFKF